ncbi:uncharacterized protein LOC118426820 [Branchiostoma floridae]|uniref:Uncharacterized protein LOC118426820 n=1 Tax=Branchiostoma floridae TaxID=7739 RepID=A0A9J7LZQ6_BRAFL|nr:uncharacterized protein LOC118426820 [Branchiostoma floridae]XP_035692247.1 uncharacterized protein LOC118426820 [Branchiostoma floridae]
MDSGNTLQRSISMTSEDGSGSERRNSEDREAYVEKMRKWYLEMWHSEAKKVKQQGDEMKMIEDSLIDYFTMVAKAGVSWGPLAIAMGLSSIDLAVIRRDCKTIDQQIPWVLMKWRHIMKKKGRSGNVDADSVIEALERNKAYGALKHLNENVLKELGKEWIDTRPTEIIESQAK